MTPGSRQVFEKNHAAPSLDKLGFTPTLPSVNLKKISTCYTDRRIIKREVRRVDILTGGGGLEALPTYGQGEWAFFNTLSRSMPELKSVVTRQLV